MGRSFCNFSSGCIRPVLAASAHENKALLCINHAYAPGEGIVIDAGVKHLWVQMDAALLPGEVYLPTGRTAWPVPHMEHHLACSPATFSGERHMITARVMPAASLTVCASAILTANGPDRAGALARERITPLSGQRPSRGCFPHQKQPAMCSCAPSPR